VNSIVTVLFFASIREAIGHDRELISSEGLHTLEDLRRHLCAKNIKYAEALETNKRWRVALNQEVADLASVLSAGDEVAFFPPVTGG